MAEIVNLRRTRKAKLRQAAEAAAEVNRAAFGRTKSERRVSELEQDRAERRLEGHRLPASPQPSADGSGDGDD